MVSLRPLSDSNRQAVEALRVSPSQARSVSGNAVEASGATGIVHIAEMWVAPMLPRTIRKLSTARVTGTTALKRSKPPSPLWTVDRAPT